MKKLLPLLFVLFAACSKNDDVQPPAKTYLTITNNLNYDLDNVVVGEKGKLLLSIPSFKKGDVSQTIETTASVVDVYFDDHGKTYAIMDPYPIKTGITNTLSISSGATVIQTSKTGANYPK